MRSLIHIFCLIYSLNTGFSFKHAIQFENYMPLIDLKEPKDSRFNFKENLGQLLESLDLDRFTFSKHLLFNTPILNLELTLQGVLENGTQITINNASLDDNVNLVLNLMVEDFNFHGSYIMNGLAARFLPLIGHGEISLQMKKLTLATYLKITPISGVLFLDQFDFLFETEDMKVSIGGLLNNPDVSELLDKFIGDLVPQLICNLNRKISHAIENFIINDPTMSKMQLEDILGMGKLLM